MSRFPSQTHRTSEELASVCREEQSPLWFRVRDPSEEGYCSYCGYALVVDDEAYEFHDETYCSRLCATTDQV